MSLAYLGQSGLGFLKPEAKSPCFAFVSLQIRILGAVFQRFFSCTSHVQGCIVLSSNLKADKMALQELNIMRIMQNAYGGDLTAPQSTGSREAKRR